MLNKVKSMVEKINACDEEDARDRGARSHVLEIEKYQTAHDKLKAK
jgi:hypothetical protein